MTRHEITQTCRKGVDRSVTVERRRKRKLAHPWSRREVHAMGLAIVADALKLHDEGLGGVMTGMRAREMDRKGASKPVAKIDMRPVMLISEATIVGPKINTAPGLLAADISRNIFPDRQRQFGADLIGSVL